MAWLQQSTNRIWNSKAETKSRRSWQIRRPSKSQWNPQL
jgi:hypothetical protein